MMKTLVIDIGGTNVKLRFKEHRKRKFASGRDLTPQHLAAETLAHTQDWDFDRVSIGYPGVVTCGRITAEPHNLGRGWVGFDFAKKLGRPVKVLNDAAMQALGSYEGGRMLFVGLGTGFGSALILNGVIIPLELGRLRLLKKEIIEERLGKAAIERLGVVAWEEVVHEVVATLRESFVVDYVVIGGGGVKLIQKLPEGARKGSNRNAHIGGERLWSETFLMPSAKEPLWAIV